jgi:hypothetical protein
LPQVGKECKRAADVVFRAFEIREAALALASAVPSVRQNMRGLYLIIGLMLILGGANAVRDPKAWLTTYGGSRYHPMAARPYLMSKESCLYFGYGAIGLGFAAIFVGLKYGSMPDEPVVPEKHYRDKEFQAEGELSEGEADRILPRLEKEKIRFQISANPLRHDAGRARASSDPQIKLFIHTDDIVAWRKIRDEYFPI